LKSLADINTCSSPYLANAIAELLQASPEALRSELAAKFATQNLMLQRKLGEGAMGVVYEAWDTKLNRSVAIKLLSADRSLDNNATTRLMREAQAAAQLNHPNIVSVHNLGEIDGMPFIVQQLVRGRSLADMLKAEGVMKFDDVVELAIQIASGLAQAHRHGIVHRDLKPDNILIEDETKTAQIADFGISLRKGLNQITSVGTVAGTPVYMSPEQARGQTIDGRSDLFSLGIVLYRCLSNRSPFDSDDPHAVIHQICAVEPTSIRELRSDVPLAIERIIHKLIRKDLSQRYDSAEQLIDDLNTYRFTRTTTNDDPSKVVSVDANSILQKPKSNLGIYTGIATIAILCVGVSIYYWLTESDSKTANATVPFSNVPSAMDAILVSVDGRLEKYSSIAEAIRDNQYEDLKLKISGSGELPFQVLHNLPRALSIIADPNSRVVIQVATSDDSQPWLEVNQGHRVTIEGVVFESIGLSDDRIALQANIRIKGGQLEVKRCRFDNRETLANLYIESGSLSMSDCVMQSDQGVGLLISSTNSNVTVDNCWFDCTTCFAATPSNRPTPISMRNSKDTDVKVSNSTLNGTTAFSKLFGNTQKDQVKVRFSNTIFQTSNELVLATVPNAKRTSNLELAEILGLLSQGLNWDETNCIHREDAYFISTSLVLPRRVLVRGVTKDPSSFKDTWDQTIAIQRTLARDSKSAVPQFKRNELPTEFGSCGADLPMLEHLELKP
jgi:serine/threonine protein kinase